MTLRPYQQECVDTCINHILNSNAPIVAELATGAGKSLIVSAIAEKIHEKSKGKHILCLAPSAELVKQNREKYLTTGKPASVYSASAGGKCLKHPVVFGTPQTIVNALDKFGNNFALIIIDEAHGLTKSVKKIIEDFKNKYPKLRVLGLTASPYRMGTGYIYQNDINNKSIPEDEAKDPFFTRLVFQLRANYLIEQGYLTPPKIGGIGGESYDTLHMKPNKMGKFNSKEVDQAFLGKGRKTAYIVQDVVEKSRDRKSVMLFGATVEHAYEIMESLPTESSEIVTGATSKKERESIIKRFTANKIKYLVSVATLTTGFDAPVVDVIALLRATESAGLLQQIIGRGLRLYENKKDVLILDYAENIERHKLENDIFNPEIKVIGSGGSTTMEQPCPHCNHINLFSVRKNDGGYEISEDGYYVDLNNIPITNDDGIAIPAHYGRRCNGYVPVRGVEFERCSYRWSLKVCPECDAENDIAARKCKECKTELVNPNDKLKIDYEKRKKDPTQIQCDEVLDYSYKKTISMKGNECLKVHFVTPHRNFSIWIPTESKSQEVLKQQRLFKQHYKNIKTVQYVKNTNGFYSVLNYNEEIDKCPTQQKN